MRYPMIACAAMAAMMSVSMTTGAALGAESRDWSAKEEVKEAWTDIKSFTVDRKEDAVAAGRQLMDDVNARIEKLEAKSEEVKADAREDWQRDLDRLREIRAVAARKLEALGDSTTETWDDVKEGFGEALDDLADTFERARSSSR